MTKWFLLFSAVFYLARFTAQASEVIIITGIYTGENLYVQNPMTSDNTFSTEEVFVNESLVLSNPVTSAYTIDLSHIQINQQIEVKIVHKDRFQPKIVNAHVIRNPNITTTESYSGVENVFIWINVDGTTIRWLTNGEKGGGAFEIQKAYQEEWVLLEKIPAKLEDNESVYRVQVLHDKGENTYRIKLTDRDGYVTYSNLINYRLR